MKRITAIFLLLVMILAAVTGCGTEDEITKRPTVNFVPEGDDSTDDIPDYDTGLSDPTIPFTVKLIYDEEIFYDTEGITVNWTSRTELYRATFDHTGVASVTGLDGIYNVTLEGLPEAYMYDANVHTASNNNRDITIEIFKFIKTKGTGAGLYQNEGCIQISQLGAYTATVKSKDAMVYYEFTPKRSGTYVIDTICDIRANVINPSLQTYTGSHAFKQPSDIIDSGASEADYTRNARYQVWVSAENVGQSFTFAVKATHKNNEYPINVSFIVRFYKDYQAPTIERTPIYADEAALAAVGKITNATIVGDRVHYLEEYVGQITVTRTNDNGYQYDELVDVYKFDYTEGASDNPVGLNPDDGFYHLYNPQTGKYDGPILYAKLTRRTRFFSDYIPPGGPPTEVSFESFHASDPVAALSQGTENYRPFINAYIEYVDNDYGVYPVTEELKDFLQKFAEAQLYFQDGDGWAETSAEVKPGSLPADNSADPDVISNPLAYTPALGRRIYASEDSQWLFACCYYT